MTLPILQEYCRLKEEIYRHFGFQEQWHDFPLRDETKAYWLLIQASNGHGNVAWAYEPLTHEVIEKGEEFYDASIYTYRHFQKWVYEAAEHTMVVIDTNTDDNRLLAVFTNSKRCWDAKLIQLYAESWSPLTLNKP